MNAWKVNTNKFGNYYYPTGLNSTANKFLIKETKKNIGVMETRKIEGTNDWDYDFNHKSYDNWRNSYHAAYGQCQSSRA